MFNTIFSVENGVADLDEMVFNTTGINLPKLRQFPIVKFFDTGSTSVCVIQTEIDKFVVKELKSVEEALPLFRVESEYLIKCYGLFEGPYLLMEYFEGEDGFDEETVVYLAQELKTALLVLKSYGLHHDDLIIDNVLTDGVKLKLIDWQGNRMYETLKRWSTPGSIPCIKGTMLHQFLSTDKQTAERYKDLPADQLVEIATIRHFADVLLGWLGLSTSVDEWGIDFNEINAINNDYLRELILRLTNENLDNVPHRIEDI